MLTKTYVATGGSKFEALLLAPLYVASECRKHGLGSKLVTKSFEYAKDLGSEDVFVFGDPSVLP